jgi:hypothetical protein
MTYASSFARFVCVGDTIQADVDGFTVTARIVHDESTRPDDFDCYDDAIVAAWRNDEWFFCGVCVQVSRAGIDLTGPYGAALWGVEANFPGSDNYGYDGGTNYAKANKVYNRELMRRAKAAMGLTGVRGARASYGDTIEFRPYGSCTVLFIT